MSLSPLRDATPMRAVFAFLFAHWWRQPWLVARIGGAMVLATVTEIFVPFQAGRLIDALALGPGGGEAAVTALVIMGLLGTAMIALRLVALGGYRALFDADDGCRHRRGLSAGAAPVDRLARQ